MVGALCLAYGGSPAEDLKHDWGHMTWEETLRQGLFSFKKKRGIGKLIAIFHYLGQERCVGGGQLQRRQSLILLRNVPGKAKYAVCSKANSD